MKKQNKENNTKNTMFRKKVFNQSKQAILKAKEIVIVSHIDPDGDTIGCLLALGLAIESLGKKIYMLSQDGVPKMYKKLPGADRILRKISKSKRVDLAIAVDCNTSKMLGRNYVIFKRAKNTVAIDHHEFREPFSDIKLIDTNAAAVGEIIYTLLGKLRINITEDIAVNILASIIVETNSFRLPNIRPFTFMVCADLLKTKIDFSKLTNLIYWSKTKEAAILSGVCLGRIRFLNKGKLVWSIVSKKDFKKLNAKDEDVDSVANDMLSIKSVKMAVFFREKSEKILRVSLRSKGKINIAILAKMYGGGGHFDSAGCIIPNRKKAIKKFLTYARKLIDKPCRHYG